MNDSDNTDGHGKPILEMVCTHSNTHTPSKGACSASSLTEERIEISNSVITESNPMKNAHHASHRSEHTDSSSTGNPIVMRKHCKKSATFRFIERQYRLNVGSSSYWLVSRHRSLCKSCSSARNFLFPNRTVSSLR